MPRILLVEDNEEHRQELSMTLKNNGFDVVLASDGQTGVEKAKSEKPDLILMDMIMPGLDGLQATLLIREDGSSLRVPIIGLTVQSLPGEQEKAAVEAGCDAYHTKPVNFDRLLAQIETLIKSERLETKSA